MPTRYSLKNNVLHGFPSAYVLHVASKNLLQDSISDVILDSHCFCLAMEALVIVDFLDVDEQAADVCEILIASRVAVLVFVEGMLTPHHRMNQTVQVIQ